MNKEQISLDISKSIDIAKKINQNKKELKKLKKNNITSNFERTFIYTSLLYLLQLFVMDNTVSSFIFLTGATHLLNNSLFPELINVVATISEMLAKIIGGTLLNTIHNRIFNKTKNYNSEKELAEDIVNKEIEFDINCCTLIMYDDILEQLYQSNLANTYEDLEQYKTLKINDDKLKEKYEELKNILTKRRIIGDYIQAFSCMNNTMKDKDFEKLKYARWIFWWLQSLISSNYLRIVGLKSNLLLSITTFIALLVGCNKTISYKNSTMVEVLNEKKLAIDSFNMPQDIQILKNKYDKINQELETKGREIVDLYYNYCVNQITIENNESKTTVLEGKKPISKGIVPIDRGLETEPVVVKSRILKREDNV